MTSPTTTFRTWVLRVLALALVIVLVIAVVVAIRSHRAVRSHDRADAQRRAATVAAEEFALRMDDFQASSAKAYTDGIKKTMTTKGQTDFDSAQIALPNNAKATYTQLLTQLYTVLQPKKGAKKGTKAPKGKIIYAGVSDIDDDSATVLVAHDTTGGSATVHCRWKVQLQKVDHKWLVEDVPTGAASGLILNAFGGRYTDNGRNEATCQ